MSIEGLTQEQWELLNTPLKKDTRKTRNKTMVEFGAEPDKIPPLVFTNKPWRQQQL